MSRTDNERVADILDAAAELEQVVAAGHESFKGNAIAARAAERLLEIIGEASNALSDDFRVANADIPWRDITALRILLAHHYHRIDRDQVWQIAAVSIPEFVRQLGHERD